MSAPTSFAVRPSLNAGDEVTAGGALGRATGGKVYFELAQGGTPIDPAPFLQLPR